VRIRKPHLHQPSYSNTSRARTGRGSSFDAGQNVKAVAIWAMVVLASGCAVLHTVRDEKEAIGLFRSTDIGGTREIELRQDHSCVMSSYTASGKAPLVHATWSFNGGFVTISPISSPPIFFEVARRSFELVLISPSGRGIYVRVPEKEPNE
jgi:hypothetical protein